MSGRVKKPIKPAASTDSRVPNVTLNHRPRLRKGVAILKLTNPIIKCRIIRAGILIRQRHPCPLIKLVILAQWTLTVPGDIRHARYVRAGPYIMTSPLSRNEAVSIWLPCRGAPNFHEIRKDLLNTPSHLLSFMTLSKLKLSVVSYSSFFVPTFPFAINW